MTRRKHLCTAMCSGKKLRDTTHLYLQTHAMSKWSSTWKGHCRRGSRKWRGRKHMIEFVLYILSLPIQDSLLCYHHPIRTSQCVSVLNHPAGTALCLRYQSRSVSGSILLVMLKVHDTPVFMLTFFSGKGLSFTTKAFPDSCRRHTGVEMAWSLWPGT